MLIARSKQMPGNHGVSRKLLWPPRLRKGRANLPANTPDTTIDEVVEETERAQVSLDRRRMVGPVRTNHEDETAERLALRLAQSIKQHQELINRARVALSEADELTVSRLFKEIEQGRISNETAFRLLSNSR